MTEWGSSDLMQIRLDERPAEAAPVEQVQPESEGQRSMRTLAGVAGVVLSCAVFVGVAGWVAVAVISVVRAEPRDLPRVLKALPGIPHLGATLDRLRGESPSS